ncbi:MAG: N-acetylmuramic acid 6-phosphate etherase [Planctomycetota bacterium]|nr:N-acetylmuramic acid 6-phosphate etherase [Planctomycetota bacterium]
MNDRSHLLTEQRNPASINLDAMSISDAVALFNAQDQLAVAAVAKEKDNIAAAIQLVVAAFNSNGRLFYIGAGTSGRLGVLDASECPPTFRADPNMVQGIIAGGEDAMFRPQEGAEDSPTQAAADLDARHLAPNDVVMGIATGGTTAYVHGGLRHAKKIGAKTIFFSCVQPFPDETPVDVVIRPLTGPEILTGSTRLKAGTATKLVLNAITTIAMVQIGKCYENLMVDLRASNTKLRDRAARIVCTLTNASRDTAFKTLDAANGHVKLAILMLKKPLPAPAAQKLLDQSNGHLRQALSR